jgi:hypothetical protein
MSKQVGFIANPKNKNKPLRAALLNPLFCNKKYKELNTNGIAARSASSLHNHPLHIVAKYISVKAIIDEDRVVYFFSILNNTNALNENAITEYILPAISKLVENILEHSTIMIERSTEVPCDKLLYNPCFAK